MQQQQQQVMVMQPNQAMVAFGEVPVIQTDDAATSIHYAMKIINYLRCGCPAVQCVYNSSYEEKSQIEHMDNIKAGLKRLYLPGESANLEITSQDEDGIVVLITRQVQPKKS